MRDLTKGLAAIVGLVVAVGGIPWSLAVLGEGPPTTLPSGRAIADWASHPISNSALLRAMGVICWAIWALFVAALAVEIADQVVHRSVRPGRTQRRFGVPGFQRLAGACVLTAMLVMPPRAIRAMVTISPSGAAPALYQQRARPEPVHPEPTGWHRYVVHRYDSPWSIAERQLGDGSRWRELRDERGRPLWQPGHADHEDQSEREDGPDPRPWRAGWRPRIIHPGDVLLVPTPLVHDHARVDAARPSTPPTGAGIPALWATTTPAVRQEPDPPTTVAASAPPVMTAIDGFGASAPAGRSAGVQIGVSLVEAGIVSASVFGILELLRRRQSQHRPFGRRIRLPHGEAARAELAVRMGRRPEPVGRLQRAVHALLATAAASETQMPAILGAVAADDAVEMLLAEPAPAPPPWGVAAGGFGWRLADDELGAAAPAGSEPLPALAPIGRAVASDADVFVNLEAAGLLAVTGDQVRASGIVRSMATSLTGLPWADAATLILVGFGDELHAAPQARTVATIADVLVELRSTATIARELLGRHRCSSIWEARIRGRAGDGWPPTVVLCAAPPAAADLAELVSLTAPGSGVVAVVPTGTVELGRPAWTVSADAVPMPVGPLRMAVDPTILPADDLEVVGRLLTAAEDEAGVTLADPPYDRVQLGSALAAPAELDLRPPPVMVRVLGTVEIDGAAEFKRAKSRELAVYLALHPHGVGEAELDEALWPSEWGRVVPPSTRDSTVSVARSAVGGPGRLLPAQGQGREKRYQVSADVGSDFDLFCRLHRHGRDNGTVDSLRAALDLVRGRPFEGVLSGRTYTWVHTEGHARHIESEIGDAADLAARLFLERGQPLEARWTARQGLAADPLCERLWIRLMEAADVLGESQEIERLMDELDTVLELGGDFSGLHPNTLAAYDRYRRGTRPRHG